MSMTVKQLIAKLRKQDQNALVVLCDHDHDCDSGEHNAPLGYVAEASDAMKSEHGFGVVLRP